METRAPRAAVWVDAVVFDLDGVLLDTEENMRRAFAEAWWSARPDDPPPFERFATMLGAPLGEVVEALGLPSQAATVFAHASTKWQSLVGAFDNIGELLTELEQMQIPMAIATGKSHARALEALSSAELINHFDVVVGSDMVVAPKPAPDSLYLALSRLEAWAGVCRPFENPIYVGDAPRDIQAARAAEITSVAVGWGQTPPRVLLAEHPDHYVPTVLELTIWLRKRCTARRVHADVAS